MRAFLAAAALLVGAAAPPPAPAIPTDPDTGVFRYEEVVAVEGASADELYSRAKHFIANSYNSAAAAIDFDDPAGHLIIARGDFEVSDWVAMRPVHHKLTVECKDGRFRYTLGSFVVGIPAGDRPLEDKYMRKLVPKTAPKCEALLAGLKAAMMHAPKEW